MPSALIRSFLFCSFFARLLSSLAPSSGVRARLCRSRASFCQGTFLKRRFAPANVCGCTFSGGTTWHSIFCFIMRYPSIASAAMAATSALLNSRKA